MIWTAMVSINSPNLLSLLNSKIVQTRMEFEATNAAAAKAYFEKFGKVVSPITTKK